MISKHNSPSETFLKLEIQIKSTFPKGSAVQFIEIKKGEYWNVKEGTFAPAIGQEIALPAVSDAPKIQTPEAQPEKVTLKIAKIVNGQALGMCFKIACDMQLEAWKKEGESKDSNLFIARATELAEKLYLANVELKEKLER